MTHDELTEQVARAIHAAEIAYGHDDLEPFNELDPSTRGLAMAYAEAAIPIVRAAEQRRIREALLGDVALHMMTDGVNRLLPEAERDMRAALAAIGLGESEVE